MEIEDYNAKIALYFKTKPDLSHEDLAVVLTADLMYKNLPEDLTAFRKKYAHFDPSVLTRSSEGVTFLRIAEDKRPAPVSKDRLNAYLNVKFHDIAQRKAYEENALLFREKSAVASRVVEEVLGKAAFPDRIAEVLREKEEIRSCNDCYDMLRLYKLARDDRLRYEILRKIGLIMLISRIDRTVAQEDLNRRMKEVWKAFDKGLRRSKKTKKEYHLWLNVRQKVDFSTNEKVARRTYAKEAETRRQHACEVHPLQTFVCHPFTTFSGHPILHMEIRNKFRSRGKLSYASYVEKMMRKNLEFPNQVHDTIGVKIVVEKEREIPGIIQDLESFLGGSSTRKMEKNSYHRFGRRRLSEYSSPEYFVWKAIYDITLPHPSIPQIRKILRLTRDNRAAQKELKGRLHHVVNHPGDFVIEVQLQDIKSYLLSIAKGSSTAHAWLKMNQIRSNSFYKFFPKEIYGRDILQLKLRMLGRTTKR